MERNDTKWHLARNIVRAIQPPKHPHFPRKITSLKVWERRRGDLVSSCRPDKKLIIGAIKKAISEVVHLPADPTGPNRTGQLCQLASSNESRKNT